MELSQLKIKERAVECADENGAVYVEFENPVWRGPAGTEVKWMDQKALKVAAAEAPEGVEKLNRNNEHSSGMQEY